MEANKRILDELKAKHGVDDLPGGGCYKTCCVPADGIYYLLLRDTGVLVGLPSKVEALEVIRSGEFLVDSAPERTFVDEYWDPITTSWCTLNWRQDINTLTVI